MRKIGDILIVKFGNYLDGQKCKITDRYRVDGETTFNIELLEKQFNWKTGHDDLIFKFSNVHYCSLKEGDKYEL